MRNKYFDAYGGDKIEGIDRKIMKKIQYIE